MPEFIPQNFDVQQYVHRFPNLIAQYHVNKASFSSKLTLNEKRILKQSYQQMQKIPRNAYNIVLFTYL